MDVGFRKELANVFNLGGLGFPIVAMSATLTPTIRRLFWERMYGAFPTEARRTIPLVQHVPELLNFTILVASPPRNTSVEAVAVKICEAFGLAVVTKSPEFRGVVFTRTVEQTKAIARSLRAHAYCKDLDNNILKHALKSWSKSGKWMVATSALMQGMDEDFVQCVVFVGNPYGLLNFVQGMGRAGRRGLPAYIIYIPSSNDRTVVGEDIQLVNAASRMAKFKGCLKSFCTSNITDECDEGLPTCLDVNGSERCGNCDPCGVPSTLLKLAVNGEVGERLPVSIDNYFVSKLLRTGRSSFQRSLLPGNDEQRPAGFASSGRTAQYESDARISSQPANQSTSKKQKLRVSSASAPSSSYQGAGTSMSCILKGKAVQLDIAQAKELKESLGLDVLGLTGKCIACWMLLGVQVDLSMSDEQPRWCSSCYNVELPKWCRSPIMGSYQNAPDQSGFFKWKKVDVRFPVAHTACYNCWLPQDHKFNEMEPSLHEWKYYGDKCNMVEVLPVLIFVARHNSEFWGKICKVFTDIHADWNVHDLGRWLVVGTGRGLMNVHHLAFEIFEMVKHRDNY
jgi:superfamily II DNA/RNA helicase